MSFLRNFLCGAYCTGAMTIINPHHPIANLCAAMLFVLAFVLLTPTWKTS